MEGDEDWKDDDLLSYDCRIWACFLFDLDRLGDREGEGLACFLDFLDFLKI